MDFISAKSEADAIAESRKENNLKLANIIIKTMPSIVNSNRKNAAPAIKQLRQLLEAVPMEDRVEVLIYVFFKMC